MKKIWFIAWRNVWRNRIRSLVVILAVTLGTVSGIFVAGLMKGWSDQRVKSCIYTEVSHIKIQHPEYLINEDISAFITENKTIKSVLDSLPGIKAWTSRIKVGAVVSNSRASSGIILVGVDTFKNSKVTDIQKYIIKNSTFLSTQTRIPPIVIGDKTAENLQIKIFKITDKQIDSLAKELNDNKLFTLKKICNKRYYNQVKFEEEIIALIGEELFQKIGTSFINQSSYYQLNSKIVASFSEVNSQLAYNAFQVVGIYKTNNSSFDQLNGFVLKDDLARCSGLAPDQVHEIAIIVDDEADVLANVEKKLKRHFPTLSVLNWKKLSPDASLVYDFLDIYNLAIMIVIYLALAFGIINTMMMAVLERTKELGMLMAIGMKRFWVFIMILLETIFLTTIGAFLGLVLGYILVLITGKSGLSFVSIAEGYEAIGWSSTVYPSITGKFLFQIMMLVLVVAIISSVIPARKVLKLPIIDILKNE